VAWLLDYPRLLAFGALFVIGYVAGRLNERRHYASIRRREKELAGVLLFSIRVPPETMEQAESGLVSGSAVISDDYFKSTLSGLYNILGGRMRSYESLIDRARREAVLRMKHQARNLGAETVINVKFQTSAIGGLNANSVRGVELLAYGTALAPARQQAALEPLGT